MMVRENLAKLYYKIGDLEKAVELIRIVTEGAGSFEAKRLLGKWERELYIQSSDSIICKWCGAEYEE